MLLLWTGTCIRRRHLLERRFDDCFGGIVRNYVYNSHAKFCRVPMEESPTNYDIPEPCQIWMEIWTSLVCGLHAQIGGPLEDPTVHLLQNSHIYHPSKFQLDPTVQTPGTFR